MNPYFNVLRDDLMQERWPHLEQLIGMESGLLDILNWSMTV